MSLAKQWGLIALALAFVGCSDMLVDSASYNYSEEENTNNEDLYEVHYEDKIYIFDDVAVYKKFLATGNVVDTKTLEQPDAAGRAVIFGLRPEDKDKTSAIASMEFYRNAMIPAPNFYGEVRADGRIYVFDRAGEMKSLRDTGAPQFSYTDIGSGPQGETVVYVLSKDNSDRKPEALIQRFKTYYQLP